MFTNRQQIFPILPIFLVLLFGILSPKAVATELERPWPETLAIDGGGIWNQRVEVTVRLPNDSPPAEGLVGIKLGNLGETGGVSLAGVRAESVRVVDPTGEESLFELLDGGDQPFHRGEIAAGAMLILPISAATTGSFFIYWDNPEAWELPDWLDEAAKKADAARAAAETVEIVVGKGETTPFEVIWPDGWDETTGPAMILSRLGLPTSTRTVLLWVTSTQIEDVDATVFLPAESIARRWNRPLDEKSFSIVTCFGQTLEASLWNGQIFFEAPLCGLARNPFLLIEQTRPATHPSVTAVPPSDLPPELAKRNRVVSEPFSIPSERIPGWEPLDMTRPDIKIIEPDNMAFGTLSLKNGSGPGKTGPWHGITRPVPVVRGHQYYTGFWLADDSAEGGHLMHYHQRRADGMFSRGGIGACGGSKTAEKRAGLFHSGPITASADTAFVLLNLITDALGKVTYENFFFSEIKAAVTGQFFGGRDGIYQVPTIAKVYPETLFSSRTPPVNAEHPATLDGLRNEAESLQLAIRFSAPGVWRVKADAPTTNDHVPLSVAPEIFAVGYVPVDYPSSYYLIFGDTANKRLSPGVSPACDGWKGMWPDPLIPILPNSSGAAPAKTDWRNDSTRLAAFGQAGLLPTDPHQTRSLWLCFSLPTDAAPGLYLGHVTLENITDGREISIPYQLRVYDVAMPDVPQYGAIFDIRSDELFCVGNESAAESRRRLIEFSVSQKISPDVLPATPNFVYAPTTGTSTADWTEFDSVAEWYFDKLGNKFSYTPSRSFYLFGWSHEPRSVEGEPPYEGPAPHEHRSIFRPEYRRAYQANLRCFWDHVTEKGWQDRFVLYLSDEPFFMRPEIVEQLRGICDMIHEVDSTIPVYTSCWEYVPAWDGAVDVWGIGHFGIVPSEQIEKLTARGDRIWWTTDGQFCLDTPYCGIERLLPWSVHRWGADAYEFWGSTWYTYDPFSYAWHRYIDQSDTPGLDYKIRYPNGDGYIFYPGKSIGLDGVIRSVRSDAARDGQEDATALFLLKTEIDRRAGQKSDELDAARDAYESAIALVPIPTPCGRLSTQFVPDPHRVGTIRASVNAALEKLLSVPH